MSTDAAREVLCRGIGHREFSGVQRAIQAGRSVELVQERDVPSFLTLQRRGGARWLRRCQSMRRLTSMIFPFKVQGLLAMTPLNFAGLAWIQHHEGWLKKSGVRALDRSVHEHSSVCRALNLMMCYDQLNLPAIAAAEALNRRRTLIEHAHQGRPDAPSMREQKTSWGSGRVQMDQLSIHGGVRSKATGIEG